jgi:hypothetical protein
LIVAEVEFRRPLTRRLFNYPQQFFLCHRQLLNYHSIL